MATTEEIIMVALNQYNQQKDSGDTGYTVSGALSYAVEMIIPGMELHRTLREDYITEINNLLTENSQGKSL